MKTLFEQLTKENQQKVLNYKYKSIRGAVVEELESKHFFTDLRINEALSLHDIIFGCLSKFDINNYIGLFHHDHNS